MNDRLVTIASFATPLEAQLAKNRLADSGIRAALEAEATTSMAWHLTNAIGGVKLLVMEQDAERAVAILDEADVGDGEAIDDGAEVDVVEESHFDDDWSDEEDEESDEDANDETESDEPEEKLTDREENADRALRGAVIGLLFWPLLFYVLWVLVKVFISDERLRPEKRKQAFIAAAICIPVLLAWCWFIRTMA